MKNYDRTILTPAIISAITGVVLVFISGAVSNSWAVGLLMGFGINIFTISITLVLIDMYRWFVRRRTFGQSYEILKANLLGVLGQPTVWLLEKYAVNQSAKNLLQRSVKFNNESSLSTVAKYISDELIRLERKHPELDKIALITAEEAEWLKRITEDTKANLGNLLDLYLHLIDDPELIDQIAKLRGNMANAITGMEYLAGNKRIPMNKDVAVSYIKYMFYSYVGLIRYIKEL